MPIYSAEEYDRKHGHSTERNPIPTDCATSNYPRKLHGEETWRFLQKTFHETTYARKSYHHRTHARNRNLPYSGVDDYYVEARNNVTGRGRGMYAIRDIPAGTRLWYDYSDSWIVNDGYWYSREKMIDYLERLPYELQCDVLLWAYAALPLGRTGGGGTAGFGNGTHIECNLDEASYFNHAERPELVNMGGIRNIAFRDIRKGEELLLDYGSFIALGTASITWWDDLRNTAWNEPSSSSSAAANTSTAGGGRPGDNGSVAATLELAADDLVVSPDRPPSSDQNCMDGYVKYGAPKTSSAFVDARPLHVHGRPVPEAPPPAVGSVLAGIGLSWVLCRGLAAAVGVRRVR